MIIRKSPEEIEKIAAAGQILARCLTMLRGKARPGVTTADLDQAAEKFIRSQGATPAFKGYRGFPGSICASPNSMVVHGIPGPYKLSRGDILSIDVGVVLDGWVADAAVTVPIGQVSPVARRLLETTKASLFEAVEQCRPGQPARRRLPRGSAAGGGGRLLGGALAGRPRRGPRHARGSADPELRRAGHRGRAAAGHGPGGRADGERGRPPDPDGRRTTGRSTRRTGRWPPISSTRWPSRRRVRASSRPGTSRRRAAPREGPAPAGGRLLSLRAAGLGAKPSPGLCAISL